MSQCSKSPSLVSSTNDIYSCTIAKSKTREFEASPKDGQPQATSYLYNQEEERREVNYFKSAQWSPDGTSLITSSADNTIRTFILPPTLLDTTNTSIPLIPYAKHTFPTSINCITTYPLYDLASPSTTLYLSTPTSLPIRLSNALSTTPTPLSTYPFISPTTEAYYTPSSLLWSSPNTFLAGTDCLIGLFDVTRNGEGPLLSFPTIPSKRHKMKGGGVGMRGIVSALSQQPSSAESPHENGILAAGTWTRCVGLYDAAGMGGTVATWSIAEAADAHAEIGGAGITQTAWSKCGRYLYVVERKSGGVLVFDVRVTSKLVGWLEGREAWTNQRLGVDVFEGEKGMEVWAGGVDGVVRVWEGVGLTEGGVERSWEWKAHDDPVTSTVLHSTGTVVATSSGQRAPLMEEVGFNLNIDDGSSTTGDTDDDVSENDDSSMSSHSPEPLTRTPDNSIKVWSL